MRIKILFVFFICLLVLNISAALLQKSETDPAIGSSVIRMEGVQAELNTQEAQCAGSDLRLELLWETSHASSICGGVNVSSETQNSFARWQTNVERVSLFHDSAMPLWEHSVGNLDFDYPIDMTEDGSVLAVGDGNILKIFSPASQDPTWTLNMDASLVGLQLDAFGTTVYVAYNNAGENMSYVQAYMVGDEELLWESSFPGGCGTLTICEDASTLIFTQYGGGFSFMWVIETTAGDVIFQAPEYNQNPPAMSADGSIIVNGDYSGYLWVYQYDEEMETYTELWHYHVNGGGTSDWIGGMAISEDGSTIACGTLTFITDGYNGQVYLFDIASPTPIWVYDNAGDYVIDVDLSADGSILAACGYGPYAGTAPDFFLFKEPVMYRFSV
ncbi:MAG: hypothetical protein K9N06_12425 [Candidatus Cloacimonetes bacterium]|nr:hypothetical protein [Candidatus Cloacimonadota bacterium]